MNTCDIIIPTYNGRTKLMRTIPALLAQEIPPGWTVRLIVSDDGSSDSPTDFFAEFVWGGAWAAPIVIENNHGGRSRARNSALHAATADVLLLLADDMVLRPRALYSHLVFHTNHPDTNDAALGCVMWDPRVRPTPFMEWMTHGGQQNDYDSLLGVRTCNASSYFYGSFLSIKRACIGAERFSETFSAYGWEDLELGARLEKKGVVLHVLHNAISLHAHRYTASAIMERQRTVGSAKYLVNTNVSRRVKHFVYRALGAKAVIGYIVRKWGDTTPMPRIFALATAGEFWYGVHCSGKLLKSEKV